MLRVGGHIGHQALQSAGQQGRALVSQPVAGQQLLRARVVLLEPGHDGLRDPGAGLLVLQQLDELGQHVVQQRLVAAVVREGVEHRRQSTRHVHLPDQRARGPLDEALHLRILHRLQRSRCEARGLVAEQRGVAGRSEPLRQPLGRIVPADQRHQRGHIQELIAHKGGQVAADARLVARDDRRVRNGQAERPAEPRHHRKPVGQRTHHGGLGHGFHRAEPQAALGHAGGNEHGRDQQQQAQGLKLGAAQRARLIERSRIVQAHRSAVNAYVVGQGDKVVVCSCAVVAMC